MSQAKAVHVRRGMKNKKRLYVQIKNKSIWASLIERSDAQIARFATELTVNDSKFTLDKTWVKVRG